MAEPTSKNPEVDKVVDNVLGMINPDTKGRRASILGDVCAICNKSATVFKDDLSRKEYRISGLCQRCQDKLFG